MWLSFNGLLTHGKAFKIFVTLLRANSSLRTKRMKFQIAGN